MLSERFYSLSDDFELVVPGRQLLLEGELMKVCRKARKLRHFFMFVFIIFLLFFAFLFIEKPKPTKPNLGLMMDSSMQKLSLVPFKIPTPFFPPSPFSPPFPGPRYIFRLFLPLKTLKVRDFEGGGEEGVGEGGGHDCGFMIISPQKSFVVFASNRGEKQVRERVEGMRWTNVRFFFPWTYILSLPQHWLNIIKDTMEKGKERKKKEEGEKERGEDGREGEDYECAPVWIPDAMAERFVCVRSGVCLVHLHA